MAQLEIKQNKKAPTKQFELLAHEMEHRVDSFNEADIVEPWMLYDLREFVKEYAKSIDMPIEISQHKNHVLDEVLGIRYGSGDEGLPHITITLTTKQT